MSAGKVEAAAKENHNERGAIWVQNDINFPYVLEDPNVELEIVEKLIAKKGGARCLVPASGGDTVFALANSAHVKEAIGFDLNQGQVHCCRLKEAAYRRFAHCVEDFLRFFHNVNNGESADKTLQAWRLVELTALLSTLPQDTQDYWHERQAHVLDQGIYAYGFRQRDCVRLVTALRAVKLHPYENSERLTAENREQWNKVWQETVLTKMPGNIGSRVGGIVWEACVSPDKAKTMHWFFRSWLGFPHTASSQLPVYLQGITAYEASKENQKKVKFVYQELSSLLRQVKEVGDEKYDLIHISTILDGVTPDIRAAILTSAADALAPGGYVLFRSGPFPNPMNSIDPQTKRCAVRGLIGEYFSINHAVSDEMTKKETLGIYYDVVLAQAKKT